MAVGYEKLNTSAARSRRTEKNEIPRDRIRVEPKGVLIWDATYGFGKTIEPFVSDSDKVQCEFDSGFVVILRGGAVRCGISNRGKKNKQ